MGKLETISGTVEADVHAEIEAAIARGDLTSSEQLVSELVTDWAASQRVISGHEADRIRALIEESRADPRPSIPLEDVIAELEARYADPA